MPYTVPVSFDKFIENISLTGDHTKIADDRAKHLVSLLENHFKILDAFATGSIPKGTALKAQADLDVMVVLHWEKHIKNKNPEKVLQDVRDALGEYKTNVRKNGQAVTLYYDSWPNVDIVPVSRSLNNNDTVNHYNVPDMNSGTWIPSRPRKHATAVGNKETECGPHFTPIVRMIKQWNKEHSDLMESFHIEVLALNVLSGVLSDYSWDIFTFFDQAANLIDYRLSYEDGYADDYLTYDTRKEVKKRLETARDKARDAWYLTYESRGEHKEGIELWQQIFGGKFPAYG